MSAPPRPDLPPALTLNEQLWQETFDELKKLARSRLYASGSQVQLNTTALVNESYLRLCRRAGELSFETRSHFFAYASKVMRSVIVDLVRERCAERGGGDLVRVTFDTAIAESVGIDEEPVRIDRALRELERVEPRLASVVEMRYFAGLSDLEIADVMGVSDRTVRRDWDKARAILKTMLG
ncbi:MAG: ECF-type sigma factor [Caldimonas sp.]